MDRLSGPHILSSCRQPYSIFSTTGLRMKLRGRTPYDALSIIYRGASFQAPAPSLCTPINPQARLNWSSLIQLECEGSP